MNRPRIAQILEATTGGTRRHLNDIVNGIDARRVELHVICATLRDPAFGADIETMRARGIPVHVVPMVRAVSPRRDMAACRRMACLLRRYRFDGVHTHSSKAGVLGRIAARRTGVPVVMHTPHVLPLDMRAGAGARWVYRLIERRLARWTDRIVCVSQAGMVSAAGAGLAPSARYDIIPNGVDVEVLDRAVAWHAVNKTELGIPADVPVVGAVGRLTRQKNFRLLVAAAARVHGVMPETRFVIFGEGEERQRLETDIVNAGLADRIFLPGAREDIYAWYPHFDVFAMSSDWEGMPYSLLEAMGSRGVVVATAVGGVAEVVQSGTNGVLTPAGRVEPLAAALVERLKAPGPERRRMGRAARQTVAKKYSRRIMLAALEKLYLQTFTVQD